MADKAESPRLFDLAISIVSIVVGLAGIFVTVLTFPGALNAVGEALTGSGLPEGFKGLAGGTLLFAVILIGVIAIAALFFGLTCLLSLIFRYFNSPTPLGSSAVAVGMMFLVSFATTLVMYVGGFAMMFLSLPVCMALVYGVAFFAEGIQHRYEKAMTAAMNNRATSGGRARS